MSGDDDHAMSLEGLKILAIFIVLLSGLCGASAPVIFAYFFKDKESEQKLQRTIKVLTCMSIGIVIATAMIHMLPEGINQLQESGVAMFKPHEEPHEECNATGPTNHSEHEHEEEGHEEHSHPYPFGFLFALCAIAVVWIISTELNWYAMHKLKEVANVACDDEEEERMAAVVKLFMLEVGVAVHSVIIGITMGISKSYSGAVTLFIVLVVHQFFEGLAIGSLSVLAQVTFLQAAGYVVTFASTTPIGVGIGIGISGHEDVAAQGVLGCLSAGILLHMAMSDMLPHVFGSHSHHSHGPVSMHRVVEHIHGGGTKAEVEPGHGACHDTGGGHECHGHSHGQHGHGHSHSSPIRIKAEEKQNYGSTDANTTTATATAVSVHDDDVISNSGKKERNSPIQNEISESQGPSSTNKAAQDDEDIHIIDTSSGGERVAASAATAVTDLVDNPLGTSTRTSARMGRDTRKSLTTYHDEHQEDESFELRLLCYVAFIVGAGIQSVLGIWA